MLLGRVVFAFCPCLYIVHMSLAQSNETLRSEAIVQVFVPLVAQKPWRTWPTCTNGGGTKEIKRKHTGIYRLFESNWMLPKPAQRPLQKDGFLVRQQGCHGRIAPNPELCICSRYFACIICAKHSPRHWQVTANSQWRGSKYSKETKRKNLCDPHPQVQTQKGTFKKKTHQIALHISPHLLLIFSPAVQTGLKSLCKRACIHVEWLEFSYSHES